MFGNIYLTDKQGAETFDEEDERVLVVLATQAAIAVENARLYDETERKAGSSSGSRSWKSGNGSPRSSTTE